MDAGFFQETGSATGIAVLARRSSWLRLLQSWNTPGVRFVFYL